MRNRIVELAWPRGNGTGKWEAFCMTADGRCYQYVGNGLPHRPFPDAHEANRFCAYIQQCQRHRFEPVLNMTFWKEVTVYVPEVRH